MTGSKIKKILIMTGVAGALSVGAGQAVFAAPEDAPLLTTDSGTTVSKSTKGGHLVERGGNKYYYLADDTLLTDADVVVDGYGYRADSKGVLSVRPGWLLCDDNWYYSNASGELYKSMILYSSEEHYYLAEDGHMVTNSVVFDGDHYYYAGEDGIIQKNLGWIYYNKNWFYSGDEKEFVSGKVISDKGREYYLGEDSVMVANKIVDTGNGIYFATKSGAFYNKPGWIKFQGYWYYLESGTKLAQDKLVVSGGKTYYLGENAVMPANSLFTHDGELYYATANGSLMMNNWKLIDQVWYYFQSDGTAARNKVIVSKGKGYYLDEDGKMVTSSNVTTADGYAYKADANGVVTAISGWFKVGSTWYRADAKGKLYRDTFLTVNGVKYHFDETGKMSTGFFNTESGMYYAAASGAVRATGGWFKYDGEWYYSDSNGVFYRSRKATIGGVEYCFNSMGIWSENTTYDYYTGIINDTSYEMINGRRYHVDENGVPDSWFGIDVSAWNGEIDWEKVAADGVHFAIVRAGGRFAESGGIYADSKLAQNVKGATAAGIPCGVYFFTQAITVEEAIEEAEYTINAIKGLEVELPIVIDTESKSGARHNNLTMQQRTEIVKAFCETVEKAGYKAMYYAGMAWCEDDLDTTQLDYMHWCAQWWLRNQCDDLGIPYQVWQYTDVGRIDGIKGNVDLNIWYRHQNTEE